MPTKEHVLALPVTINLQHEGQMISVKPGVQVLKEPRNAIRVTVAAPTEELCDKAMEAVLVTVGVVPPRDDDPVGKPTPPKEDKKFFHPLCAKYAKLSQEQVSLIEQAICVIEPEDFEPLLEGIGYVCQTAGDTAVSGHKDTVRQSHWFLLSKSEEVQYLPTELWLLQTGRTVTKEQEADYREQRKKQGRKGDLPERFLAGSLTKFVTYFGSPQNQPIVKGSSCISLKGIYGDDALLELKLHLWEKEHGPIDAPGVAVGPDKEVAPAKSGGR